MAAQSTTRIITQKKGAAHATPLPKLAMRIFLSHHLLATPLLTPE